MSDEIDERDRLTFWRGWYNAARRFPDEQRLAWYDAVLAFAFDGVEPAAVDGDITRAIAASAVESVRETIRISRDRRKIGRIGGTKAQANAKQNASKCEAKRKQTRSKAQANANQEQVQEQVQEQEQEHVAISYSATTRGKKLPPTLKQFQSMATTAGVPAKFAEDLWYSLQAVDWTDGKGLYVDNPRRYLKSAWTAEQKKIRAARVENSDPKAVIDYDGVM